MKLTRFLLVVAVLAWASPSAAQVVKVEFANGRVSLNAQNAPVRAILAEWARVGGTRIVNGERVAGAPLTLELNNVPERQALEIVLRSVSGYMAGTRPAGTPGVSTFDRIMIVPTSAPAARAATPPPAFTPPPPPPQIDQNDPEENPPDDVGPPSEAQGGPFGPRRRFNPPNGGTVNAQPFPPQTQPDPDVDEPEEVPSVGTNPFGVAPGSGSSRPGVISPVPQQQGGQGRGNGGQEP
jgi:hypothetical protein